MLYAIALGQIMMLLILHFNVQLKVASSKVFIVVHSSTPVWNPYAKSGKNDIYDCNWFVHLIDNCCVALPSPAAGKFAHL